MYYMPQLQQQQQHTQNSPNLFGEMRHIGGFPKTSSFAHHHQASWQQGITTIDSDLGPINDAQALQGRKNANILSCFHSTTDMPQNVFRRFPPTSPVASRQTTLKLQTIDNDDGKQTTVRNTSVSASTPDTQDSSESMDSEPSSTKSLGSQSLKLQSSSSSPPSTPIRNRDPDTAIGLVVRYDESQSKVIVRFFASVPGTYVCEVKYLDPSSDCKIPISGQPWQLLVVRTTDQPQLDDIGKEITFGSFVLSCKQFQDKEHDSDLEVHEKRMQARLDRLQLNASSKVPRTGNCLFHSVSDQLYGNISKSAAIRKSTVAWLSANRQWELDNGVELYKYVEQEHVEWKDYIKALAKNETWGDYLCLIAIAQFYGSRIIIVTSVDSDEYLLDIEPLVKKTDRVIRLCHWGAKHFSSLHSGVEADYYSGETHSPSLRSTSSTSPPPIDQKKQKKKKSRLSKRRKNKKSKKKRSLMGAKKSKK